MEELLKKSHIRVKEHAETWEDAIRGAGSILEEAGSIESAYIDNMIDSVKQFGPYVVLAPKFALAHAAPGKGVTRNDMSLITLFAPVNFGSVNDPVFVVLCFCSTDPTSHVENLAKVAELLSKESRINDLADANTVDEIIRVLYDCEIS